MLQCEEQSMFTRAWRKRKHVSHQHGCNLRKAVASANYVIPQPHKVRSCFNSVSTHNLESWIILSETTETMHQVIHINEIKGKKTKTTKKALHTCNKFSVADKEMALKNTYNSSYLVILMPCSPPSLWHQPIVVHHTPPRKT